MGLLLTTGKQREKMEEEGEKGERGKHFASKQTNKNFFHFHYSPRQQ